jgi:glycosyltransferase involved in cell wall biosynthesis
MTRQNPAGSTLIDLIEVASRGNNEVAVFASDLDDCLKGKVRFYRIPILRFLGIPGALVSFHLAQLPVYFFAKFVARSSFDVVHSLDSESLLADYVTFHNCCAELFAVIKRNKLWAPVHNPISVLTNLALLMNLKFRAIIERINCRRAKHIYALTSRHKEMLINNYNCEANKIAITPNYIQRHIQSNGHDATEIRRRVRQEFHLKEDDFVALFVGQGAWPKKGLRVLLDSLAIVNRDAKAFLFVMGQGGHSEASWFKKYAGRLGVSDRVLWLGFKKEVFEYYAAADCLVLPSYHELFSLATLEGLAGGLPLLLSDTSGSDEVVKSGENGFIVRIDPCDLAQKLLLLLNDRGLLRSFAAKSTEMASNWKSQSHCERVLEQYENK